MTNKQLYIEYSPNDTLYFIFWDQDELDIFFNENEKYLLKWLEDKDLDSIRKCFDDNYLIPDKSGYEFEMWYDDFKELTICVTFTEYNNYTEYNEDGDEYDYIEETAYSDYIRLRSINK